MQNEANMKPVELLTVSLGAMATNNQTESMDGGLSVNLKNMQSNCNVGLDFADGQLSTRSKGICHLDSQSTTVGFQVEDGDSFPFSLQLKGDDGYWEEYIVSQSFRA